MNERIRQLWNKAAESTAAFPSGQNNSWETQVNFLDKFAELIVKECVDIALITKTEQLELVSDTKAFDSMPEGAKDHSFGRVVAVNQVVANIKEHFGVEE